MGLWAANCGNCRFDALSVIRIGDDAWVRADIAHPILLQTGNAAKMFSSTVDGDRLLARVATAVGGRELFGQHPISPSDRIAICARNPSGQQAAAYNAIAAVLGCHGSPVTTFETKVTLLVDKDQPTACGSTANIIACEEDTSYVELNGRDYKFCLTSEDSECLGSGARRVDIVQIMLHEVGHWIGLGHSKSPDSIMSASMDGSRCITNEDVANLAQAVSQSDHPLARGAPMAFRMVDDTGK
jgi:Matrixin